MTDTFTNDVTRPDNIYEKKPIPKRAFDKEYHTQYLPEVKWLSEYGIEPVYVRTHPVYKIRTYKYTKTARLFRLLTSFYGSLEEKNPRGISSCRNT